MTSILDAIGDTPLVPLHRFGAEHDLPAGTTIWAKVEGLNPGGSGKDRIALALLQDAEADGLRRGGIVVEATSGNTGIALAQACAVRGYRLHIVCSDKVCDEKVRIVSAFGGTVHRTPDVPHDDPNHYTNVAPRLARELGGFYLDQFNSPANARVHRDHTAPEIFAALAARSITPDAIVLGAGTGGTLRGITDFIQAGGHTTRVILADPEGSVLAGGGRPAPYLVEGIGDDTTPPLLSDTRLDDAVTVSDRAAFAAAKRLARLEGILAGGSGGCHVAAAVQVARALPAGSQVVTILPDTGRNYLSTFYDDAWCIENGVAEAAEAGETAQVGEPEAPAAWA